jgi:outer membrane protein assembly factor BamD (BamD/ComL family)
VAPAREPLAVTEPAPIPSADPAPAPPRVDRAAPKASGTTSGKTKRTASTLDAETSLLDAARGALRDGHPEAALRTLEGYDAQFPSGLLSPEATVLRIEALVRVGDDAGAGRLADSFLRAHPESPLAPRVRSLVKTNL